MLCATDLSKSRHVICQARDFGRKCPDEAADNRVEYRRPGRLAPSSSRWGSLEVFASNSAAVQASYHHAKFAPAGHDDRNGPRLQEANCRQPPQRLQLPTTHDFVPNRPDYAGRDRQSQGEWRSVRMQAVPGGSNNEFGFWSHGHQKDLPDPGANG